jgi:hypothetical protein
MGHQMEAQRLYYMLPWRKNDGNRRKEEVVSLAFNCSMVCNVAAAMMASWSIWLFVGETKI